MECFAVGAGGENKTFRYFRKLVFAYKQTVFGI